MAKPAPPKGVQLKAGGLPPSEVVVPTDELRDVLMPAIDKLNAEINFGVENEHEKVGAVQVIAERSAANLGTRVDSVPRRIFSVRNVEFAATNVKIADALLLAVDIILERDTDIAHLPQGFDAAIQMIEAYNAEHGLRPRRAEIEALAKKMVRFKNGYLRHERYLEQAEAKIESDRWVEERRELVAA